MAILYSHNYLIKGLFFADFCNPVDKSAIYRV